MGIGVIEYMWYAVAVVLSVCVNAYIGKGGNNGLCSYDRFQQRWSW